MNEHQVSISNIALLASLLTKLSNGVIKEYITPGVTKDVFIGRLSVAVDGSTAPLSPHSHTAETATPLNHDITMTLTHGNTGGSETARETTVAPAAVASMPQEMQADPASLPRDDSPETERIALAAANAHRNRQIIAPGDHPADQDDQPPDDSLYDGRQHSPSVAQSPSELENAPEARLECDAARNAAHDEAEKAKRSAAATRRRDELDSEAGSSNDPKRAAETKHALEAKRKRQQDKEERARVLKQIEDNRAEQKARQEEAKAAREAAQQNIASHPAHASGSASGSAPAAKRDDTCALQIRLFDGSTIRRTFESKMTLGHEVREWIDKEQQIAGSPYTFKQILAPQPSKTISAGEEEESLQELGLVPNATLVLQPIRSYTEAYGSGSGVASVVGGATSAGAGLVGQAAGLLGSGLGWGVRALGRVLGGTTSTREAQSGPSTDANRPNESSMTEIGDGTESNRFYNGNSASTPFFPLIFSATDRDQRLTMKQTNYEPRRKDDIDRKRD